MREKTILHSRIMGKQMKIDNLEQENKHLKEFIAGMINEAAKDKSSTPAVQNTSQLSSSDAQSQERLQSVHRLQTPFLSSRPSSDQPSDRVQSTAYNYKQFPHVSPSVQPPQPPGQMQPLHLSKSVHSQQKSSKIQTSGYSQMQSSPASSHLPLPSDCSQMQSPQASSQLRSPLVPNHMHTENLSTHGHLSTTPGHSQLPSHSGYGQVPPSNDKRAPGIGTKPSLNTFWSPSPMQHSYFANSLVHAQSQSHYFQKFPNIYQNSQHFNYRPPCPPQNSPLSHPWPTQPHTESPNEHRSALQQAQWRNYPYSQPSNFQHNKSTTKQPNMQSQMQQPFSNPLNHGFTSAQNHPLPSLTRKNLSLSSNSLQSHSPQYRYSAELHNDLHQVDHTRDPSVPFPSPQHFQQQQLSQNTSAHVNQSQVQMLGVQRGLGAGIPSQGSLNKQPTSSTQLPLSSSSSQPVGVYSKTQFLQSKSKSSVDEQNNGNMEVNDFLKELYSQVDKHAPKWYRLPSDKSQTRENLSNSTSNSASVPEILTEQEKEPSIPTMSQRSTDICNKDRSYCSQSVSDPLPATVSSFSNNPLPSTESSFSNNSFRSPPPSTLTPPLTPPVTRFLKSKVISNCYGSFGNLKEKENLSIDEDTLLSYSSTNKSYVAKTPATEIITEIAESLQSSKSTQSDVPYSYSQDDSALSPPEVTLYHDENESSSPEVAVVYQKSSASTSLTQAAVPGNVTFSQQVMKSGIYTTSVSSPSRLPVSQNALSASNSVSRPTVLTQMHIRSQAARAVQAVMQDSDKGEHSHSASSESEMLQQHKASKEPACVVSNTNSLSGIVSSTVYSQAVMAHAEFHKHSRVTENSSAGQTMHKAQANYSLTEKIISEELSELSNRPPPSVISLLNDSQQRLSSQLKYHSKVSAGTNKYVPIPVTKTVQFPEGLEVFCYVCMKKVNSKNILKHLLFGFIKCSRCDFKINRCQELEGIKLDKFVCNKQNFMVHEFNVWASNPVDFLSYRMWSKSWKTCKNSSPEKQVQDLSRYLKTLSSLKSVEPWSTALLKCTTYTSSMSKDLQLPVDEIQMPRELNINSEISKNKQEKSNIPQTLSSMHRRKTIISHTKSDESVNKTTEKSKSAIMTDLEKNTGPKNGFQEISSLSSQQVVNDENLSTELTTEQCDESLGSAGIGANVMHENELNNNDVSDYESVNALGKNNDKECITIHQASSHCQNTESIKNAVDPDCLLDTSYTMDLLEEVTEYVEIHDAWTELEIKSPSIPENNHCSSGAYDLKGNGVETTLELKNEDIPEYGMEPNSTDSEENSNETSNDLKMDGRHLIIDTDTDKMSHGKRTPHILEECPMCYEVLCPSQFTVDVKSFTVSTVCNECGLMISIRPKNSISNENLTHTHNQERKRPGPKSKTLESGIKRHKGITNKT